MFDNDIDLSINVSVTEGEINVTYVEKIVDNQIQVQLLLTEDEYRLESTKVTIRTARVDVIVYDDSGVSDLDADILGSGVVNELNRDNQTSIYIVTVIYVTKNPPEESDTQEIRIILAIFFVVISVLVAIAIFIGYIAKEKRNTEVIKVKSESMNNAKNNERNMDFTNTEKTMSEIITNQNNESESEPGKLMTGDSDSDGLYERTKATLKSNIVIEAQIKYEMNSDDDQEVIDDIETAVHIYTNGNGTNITNNIDLGENKMNNSNANKNPQNDEKIMENDEVTKGLETGENKSNSEHDVNANENSTSSRKSDLFYDERWAVQKQTNFWGINDKNKMGTAGSD